MNAIAFSLYGDDPRYLVGAVANARMAKEFYPRWEVHVWCGQTVPFDVVASLMAHGASIHHADESRIPNGMFWRFLVHDLPAVERYIVRDVDSRFSEREVKAVNEWIVAGTQLHVMRDHPYHNQSIMGCSFGWQKRSGDFSMAVSMRDAAQNTAYGKDQEFLALTLWKLAKSKTIHDSCGTFDGTRNWPLTGPDFVGEYVYPGGQFNEQHRGMRRAHCISV